MGEPFSLQLWAPSPRNAETLRLPTSAESEDGTRTFRPAGLLMPQPLPHRPHGRFSVWANELFRAVA
eukprot:145989-Alexandrium_andersonii.AAC.1